MTKEQFKQYLNEAVDAMDETEINNLFPTNQQPDLYTLMAEFTALKGEIKKLSQSSLKVNNDFQSAMGVNNDRWEDLQLLFQEKENTESETTDIIDKSLKNILFQLIDQNDLLTNTHQQFQELGTPHWARLRAFKHKLAAWQKGFDLTMVRWNKFIKSSGLHQSGHVGQLFDPQIHEAVAVQHHSDKPNNQIMETELIGYLFRSKLVRQAKVVVNKTDQEESIGVLSKKTGQKQKKSSRKKKRKGGRRR